jgi:hypothetical protein
MKRSASSKMAESRQQQNQGSIDINSTSNYKTKRRKFFFCRDVDPLSGVYQVAGKESLATQLVCTMPDLLVWSHASVLSAWVCNCFRFVDHSCAVRTHPVKHVIHPVPLRGIGSGSPASIGARRVSASGADVSFGGYRSAQRCGLLHAARCACRTLAGVALPFLIIPAFLHHWSTQSRVSNDILGIIQADIPVRVALLAREFASSCKQSYLCASTEWSRTHTAARAADDICVVSLFSPGCKLVLVKGRIG